MAISFSDSTRTYTPLPIDADQGFPQSFPVVFGGVTYRFRMYVNASPSLTSNPSAIFDLPAMEPSLASSMLRPSPDLTRPQMYLVVRVDRDLPDGKMQSVFMRKVVPELEYLAGEIALAFPVQRVAVRNLNGTGTFGSKVTGGIASRWA
ncbi:hypothetical protein [Schlesneria sp. T3-172]|uniref:hypothetical protein n=1 Tax=Schlesneria sphaerica TaxID=3373610 RepID=UPI0037CC401D